LIFIHGNGEFIDDWASRMVDFAEIGLHVLVVEYPGYGHSHGKPSRETLLEAMLAAYDWFAARPGVDPEKLTVWGRSLGGGAAGDLVMERPAAAFILQSTFSSTSALAWETFFAPGFLVRDRWDNRRAVGEFDGPILLIHGRTDDVIPFSHAQTLAQTRPGLEITEIPCGHNDCRADWEVIRGLAGTFLAANGLLGTRALEDPPPPTSPNEEPHPGS
jgi:pimeloyl-ACP methyl ester carboxylesterase